MAMRKRVFLWSHPRALSTVFELYFEARGDFDIVHEPFADVYWRGQSYEAVKRYVAEQCRENNVFIKDIAHHAFEWLVKDESFLTMFTHTFLVREPKKTVLSHYRVNPGFTQTEVGYEKLYLLFERVREVCGYTPIVVCADELEQAPRRVFQAYCYSLDIPFLARALSWKQGIRERWKAGTVWQKKVSQTTTVVYNLSRYPEVIELPNHLMHIYEYHLPYYRKLMEHKMPI